MIKHGLTPDGKNKFGMQITDNMLDVFISMQTLISLNETKEPPKVWITVDNFDLKLEISRVEEEIYEVHIAHCEGNFLVKYDDGRFGRETQEQFYAKPGEAV